jgi:hypothetical protein
MMRAAVAALLAAAPAFAEPALPTFTEETASSGLATSFQGECRSQSIRHR